VMVCAAGALDGVQLLVSSLEEAANYTTLTTAPHSAHGLLLPSWLCARISVAVVAAAVAVSCLVEATHALAYARAVEASAGSRA
jgi:hypothetical protein